MSGGYHMRNKLYILLTVLSCLSVQARTVTEDQARILAAAFFSEAQGQTKSAAVNPDDFRLVRSYPVKGTKASDSAPSLYVFERSEGGFAIVSGDDIARPMLGYSLYGELPGEDIPESLDYLLQWYSQIIEFAKSQNWESISYTDSNPILDPANTVLLNTARWGQDKPFNNLVAEIDGQKPPIGCVATAIAIVMRYYKWPKRGTGNLPSYSYRRNGTEINIDGIQLGHEYLWDKMPERYQRYTVQSVEYEQYTEEEASQVARLMYDVAVMSQINFNLSGSGGNLTNSAMKLPEYFGYDKSIRYFLRSDRFLDQDWEKMIVDEIDAGRPVLFSGASGIGHAMVIDGYNGRYFSINFGWGGTYTARPGRDYSREGFEYFFTLTPIDGHLEDLIVYYDSQDIVTHIMPDIGGVPGPVLVCHSPVLGLPETFNPSQEFQLYNSLNNRSIGSFTPSLAYVLYDSQGKVKEIISQILNPEIKAISHYFTGPQTCRITKPLSNGDKIVLSMKGPSSNNWTPLIHSRSTEIVFTSRPLSQLVEIGYTEEPQSQQTAGRPVQDLYLNLYKDLVWKLTSAQETDTILAASNQFDSRYMEGIFNRSVLFSDTQEYAHIELWLPSGKYLLWVYNPLTNETMTINLEL